MATLAAWLASRGEWPTGAQDDAAARPRRTRRSPARRGCSETSSSLAFLPLADATAFTFVTPLMVVPLASIVLGEDVTPAPGGRGGGGFRGGAGDAVRESGPGDRVGRGRVGGARRRRRDGRRDDPDPAPHPVRVDRRDRVLFLGRHRGPQPRAACARGSLAGWRRPRRRRREPAVRRARRPRLRGTRGDRAPGRLRPDPADPWLPVRRRLRHRRVRLSSP